MRHLGSIQRTCYLCIETPKENLLNPNMLRSLMHFPAMISFMSQSYLYE